MGVEGMFLTNVFSSSGTKTCPYLGRRPYVGRHVTSSHGQNPPPYINVCKTPASQISLLDCVSPVSRCPSRPVISCNKLFYTESTGSAVSFLHHQQLQQQHRPLGCIEYTIIQQRVLTIRLTCPPDQSVK